MPTDSALADLMDQVDEAGEAPAPETDPVLRQQASTLTTGGLCRLYRATLDKCDELEARVKRLKAIRAALDEEIKARAEREETDRFQLPGVLTLSVTVKDTVKYDAASWERILRELVDGGQGHVLHRRLTAEKLRAIVVSGGRLPDGLELGSIKIVRFQRGRE